MHISTQVVLGFCTLVFKFFYLSSSESGKTKKYYSEKDKEKKNKKLKCGGKDKCLSCHTFNLTQAKSQGIHLEFHLSWMLHLLSNKLKNPVQFFWSVCVDLCHPQSCFGLFVHKKENKLRPLISTCMWKKHKTKLQPGSQSFFDSKTTFSFFFQQMWIWSLNTLYHIWPFFTPIWHFYSVWQQDWKEWGKDNINGCLKEEGIEKTWRSKL